MNVLVLAVGILLTAMGWWQLDHMVAPVIWSVKKNKYIEIITLPLIGDMKLLYKQFYVLCYICMALGWFLIMIWGSF